MMQRFGSKDAKSRGCMGLPSSAVSRGGVVVVVIWSRSW